MKFSLAALLAFSLFSVFSCRDAKPDQDGSWTKKSATNWVNNNHWRHGLDLALHPSTDKLSFAIEYNKDPEKWDKAFAYLKNTNLDTLSAGIYSIDGNKIYATVTEGPPKEFGNTTWESHRTYIDLQYVIRGREKIGLTKPDRASVTKYYDEVKDLINYDSEGIYYVAQPGEFFLFFPNDIHRPNIKVDGFDLVKKIVIKIYAAETKY